VQGPSSQDYFSLCLYVYLSAITSISLLKSHPVGVKIIRYAYVQNFVAKQKMIVRPLLRTIVVRSSGKRSSLGIWVLKSGEPSKTSRVSSINFPCCFDTQFKPGVPLMFYPSLAKENTRSQLDGNHSLCPGHPHGG